MRLIHPVLFRRLWMREWQLLLIFSLSLLAFWVLMVTLYPNFADNQMDAMLDALPPFMQSIFGLDGMDFGAFVSWIVLGFNHPLVIFLYAAAGIIIGTKAVAGEISGRTSDLLFSTPIHRGQVVWTNFAFLVLTMLILALGTLGGFLSGLFVEGVDLHPGEMIWLVVNASLLYLFFGAMSLAISTWMKRSGKASGLSAALVGSFFLINFLADFWSAIAFMAPLTPFAYFNAEAILDGVPRFFDLGVLAVGTLLLTAFAHWRLNQIDL